MAVSNEQFLFSAINHSNGGTVDWAKVAEECGTTKGAAAMRFRRLKEKFGNPGESKDSGTNSPAAGGTPAVETPKKAKTPAKKAAKKRKLNEAEAEDDVETPVKAEAKDEPDDRESTIVDADYGW